MLIDVAANSLLLKYLRPLGVTLRVTLDLGTIMLLLYILNHANGDDVVEALVSAIIPEPDFDGQIPIAGLN